MMMKKWFGLGGATRPWHHSETALDDSAILGFDQSVSQYISLESPRELGSLSLVFFLQSELPFPSYLA